MHFPDSSTYHQENSSFSTNPASQSGSAYGGAALFLLFDPTGSILLLYRQLPLRVGCQSRITPILIPLVIDVTADPGKRHGGGTVRVCRLGNPRAAVIVGCLNLTIRKEYVKKSQGEHPSPKKFLNDR
jgi:hypothetical protein